MKKILFLFLAACFFFSCEKETIVIPQQHAGRTVLAFFWADNSLNSSLRDNIQTMMQGLQAMKDSAALLVYWDGEASDISWPEPCIVEYVTNGQGGSTAVSYTHLVFLYMGGFADGCKEGEYTGTYQ